MAIFVLIAHQRFDLDGKTPIFAKLKSPDDLLYINQGVIDFYIVPQNILKYKDWCWIFSR